ncbi:hypothetical protein Ciccas_009162 [Cichlidogyrus casuarinus]|uniref:Uncharacterized protein n=1 Tax=Cichlidogyrus casuarinus TaxID=1844966 RepID=A0ABD2PY94_9PLAT
MHPMQTVQESPSFMDSNDIDFRFMALSDLINELQKCSLKADSASESVVISLSYFSKFSSAHS